MYIPNVRIFLYVFQHLCKGSHDVVKRWVNEAQEAVSSDNVMVQVNQASTLTQNDTGPVGPVTPSIYWSCKMFTGPTFCL